MCNTWGEKSRVGGSDGEARVQHRWFSGCCHRILEWHALGLGGFVPLAEAKQHGWDRQLKHLQPSAPANTTTAH